MTFPGNSTHLGLTVPSHGHQHQNTCQTPEYDAHSAISPAPYLLRWHSSLSPLHIGPLTSYTPERKPFIHACTQSIPLPLSHFLCCLQTIYFWMVCFKRKASCQKQVSHHLPYQLFWSFFADATLCCIPFKLKDISTYLQIKERNSHF